MLFRSRVQMGNSIPCGLLTEVTDAQLEHSRLSLALTGSGDFFLLRANGESMINVGIDDGDLVLIRKQETAREGQIVDRIIVYENRIDIKLRSDVDALLRCDDDQQSEDAANFNEDTKDIEKVADKYHSVAVQSAKNQLDKVFSVNVISGGEEFRMLFVLFLSVCALFSICSV